MVSGLLELAGKTALVTGAARRLGAATALALADRGVHCVIHYNGSVQDAEAMADAVRSRNVQAWLVQGDFACADAAARVWEAARAEAGPVDFLINNASIFPEGSLADLGADTLFPNALVNTLAPATLARLMAASGRDGVIINFLDAMVRDFDKRHVPYHLSKKMLHDLTRMMAVEYAPGLRVNGVAPGLVLPPAGEDQAYLDRLKHSNPLQSYGCAAHVVHAVLFLLENPFVTGQVIYVDGGRNIRGTMYE